MNNILLLLVCFAVGVILRRVPRFPDETPRLLNGLVINVALPALTILYMRQMEIGWALIVPITVPWVFFALGFLFFRAAGGLFHWTPKQIGALILTGALGNTSFVGLPMIEAFYGPGALWIGMLLDQAGSFMVLSTLGIAAAVHYGSGKITPAVMIRKIVVFPPFIAMVIGIALAGVPLPEPAAFVLSRIGSTLVPMALISVGFGLHWDGLKSQARLLGVGLLFKLILAPAALLLLYTAFSSTHGEILQVSLFEAAMPPMITGAIVAVDHELDSDLSNAMVGIGIPLSFLTLPIWYWILKLL